MSLTPTTEQSRILALGPTSIRVRAGAGTGKTTTVAMVIANLVEHHGISPESILGLTFTNKAAAELAGRVKQLLPVTVDISRQVEVHTYHGFAAQLLSEFGPIAGVDSSKGIITPTYGRQLMRDVVMHSDHERLDITNMRTTDKVRRLADQMGDHLLTPTQLIRAGEIHDDDEVWATRLEMAKTLVRYNTVKAELRVVDYSDLVTRSTEILRSNPELASIVMSRYQVLVLDEYQDTNPAQRVLLTTIFTDGFPVIAVGDEDQTIYEWRGASAENFELFAQHFKQADGTPAHHESLTSNRRSGGKILDVANEVRRMANSAADLLEPAEDTDSEVATYWATDAVAEAEWIASKFEELSEQGVPWKDMAVLFRKNKDFTLVVDVLTRHDIPIEVANVGGLLSVPEISLLRAWLTVLDNPDDSAAVAQILLGSSYRLGFADLAILTSWVADVSHDADAEERPVSLVEALENDDLLESLRPEARSSVDHFRERYRLLLIETQSRNLAETCRLVLDHINAWQDIEAMSPNARLSARLNIYRFLDLADDWSPLKGRPSLVAFLDYLIAMEEEPADELDSARLSGEDAVTLVTVHRAKGLEWENVAIPAVAHGNFPAGSGAFADPIRFAEHLPVDLRLDDVFGEFPDDRKARDAFLRERHLLQEWRVAYVALTRAKKRLFMSGAHWYARIETKKQASKPSELFDIVDAHPSSRSDGHADQGPRPEVLRAPNMADAPDPLFADGWHAGLRMAATEPEKIDEFAAELGVGAEHQRLVEEWNEKLFDLDGDHPGSVPKPEDQAVSVTGLVTYAQCPKRYFWTHVDTLPRKLNPAAIRGNEIHRRIELHQRGQIPFADLEPDLYDAVDPAEGDKGGGYTAYEKSRFAENRATLVETAFTLDLPNDFKLRGRIDAVYTEDDRWEVVDFKSGRRRDDPSRIVQLQAYAVAAQDVNFGLPKPSEVNVTFAYLGGGVEEVTHHADEEWVANARTTITQLTDAIKEEHFGETPGPWCETCDFLRFCEPGKKEVHG